MTRTLRAGLAGCATGQRPPQQGQGAPAWPTSDERGRGARGPLAGPGSHLLGKAETVVYRVPQDRLVADLHPELEPFAQGEPVFATGFLVGLLEAPCMTCVRRHRAGPDQTPVGERISVRHRAPSVPGDQLTVTARCIRDADPTFVFEVAAHDQRGVLVARGEVTQRVVDVAQFRASRAGIAADRSPTTPD